jgi:hypothetical protein
MISQTPKSFCPRSSIQRLPFAMLAVLALAFSPLAADEVAVPDIETRIKNSGGSIPPAAVPILETPKPLPLPEDGRKAELPPKVEPRQPPAETAPEALPESPPADAATKPGLHGSASLAAGSPSLLSGSLSIVREREPGHGFAFSFSHDSADGYGKKKTGSGFFDRETSAGARVGGGFLSGYSNFSIGVSERSDGFQGRNPDYYAMSRRSLDWDYAFTRSGPLRSDWNMTARFGLSGRIEDSFAERSSGGTEPAAAIGDYAGFALAPSASIGVSRGALSSRLEGAISYDSVSEQDPGEAKSGRVTIVGTYEARSFGSGSLTAEARLGALVESGADPLVPFDGSLAFASESGFVRALSLSGGLSADRQDPFALASLEPFALLSGVPFHSADWNAKGNATVSVAGPFLLGVGAEWRSTALDRGILVLEESADPATALVPIGYRERDSLATRASLEWFMSGIAGSAGLRDEWMDGLGRETLHALEGSVTLFDRSGRPRSSAGVNPSGATSFAGAGSASDALSRWEATARAKIPLDSGEYPFLGVSGTVRPIPSFACTLGIEDVLPLATGRLRERNGLYAERSGTVTLSGRFDF